MTKERTEEVRNLAKRSADAAKTTAQLIEESKNNADNGVKVSREVQTILEDIVGSVAKMTQLIGEVAAASDEQTQGIGQVSSAITQMDKVTQSNAANAEESASASEELSSQAADLNDMVETLVLMVNRVGTDGNGSAVNAIGTGKRTIRSQSAGNNGRGGSVNGRAHRSVAVLKPSDRIPFEEDEFDEF